MNTYNLSDTERTFSKVITKGTQEKYFAGDYFYKVDTTNEGITEYLVTLLLQNSTLDPSVFVSYEPCVINNKSGCRSRSFLQNASEEFVTINYLYKTLTGNTDLSDYLMRFPSAKDRADYLLDMVSAFGIDVSAFKLYLNTLVQLDMLILNTDRHTHNYGFIYNNDTGTYRTAPIFDNGRSLEVNTCSKPVACTLSGSFEEQTVAFGYPVKPCFRINYTRLKKQLALLPKDLYGKKIALLLENLVKYRDIFENIN